MGYTIRYNDLDALQTSQTLQTVFFPDAKPYYTTSFDIFMITASISTGKTVVYSENEVNLKIIQDFRVNAIPTVPATVEMILNLGEVDLSSLKLIFTAGSALRPRTAKKFREKYPDIKLVNMYGTSEVGVIASTQRIIAFMDTNELPNINEVPDTNEVLDTKITSVGNAVPGVTIKIVDVETRVILGPNQGGEICVQSQRLMKGYLGSTSPYLDEQRFYLTGDLGYYDDHKHLYLMDRLKDVISYIGYKVCPTELESVLLQHLAVREAAVAGAPAGAEGEHATAFVVLRPGAAVTEAELQEYVAKEVNAIPTVPATVEMILNLGEVDLSSLKLIFTAGSALRPRTAKKFREKYPDIKLVNMYGTSEVGVIASTQRIIAFMDTNELPNINEVPDTNEVLDTKITSVGNAVPGVTIKIVDVETRVILGPNQGGEICVQSQRLMKGYLGSTSPYLDEQRFYLTGDLGYYDDHKHLYLMDRLKDVISYIGYKVCPTELESVLLQHLAVREAAVAGAPAGAEGEHATAFVVLRPGAAVTEAELQEYVAKEVTWYMCLFGGVRFLSKLPRNPNGKIMRRQLVEMLVEERKELEVIEGNV